MALEVRPVRSKKELMAFIKLPWRLYRNEPLWVPPLISERKKHLDRERTRSSSTPRPSTSSPGADGEPVGRITAHVDRRFNEFQQNEWGLFGFFEAEDDPEIAEALFSAAEGWLRERGRDRMVGPLDFSTNHECGLLVEGHDRPPQIIENWHHPYYGGLIEGQGFAKAMDLLKWELDISDREKVLPVLFELDEKLEPEHGIRVRHMRKREFEDEIRRFMEVYNSAWEKNWGFVPLSENELRAYAKDLKPILDENWAMIAEKKDSGETVGAALTLPDYNQVLKRLNGRLLPFGWAKALAAQAQDRLGAGVRPGRAPEYQHTGVAASFYIEHFNMATKTPQTWGEMGWILEVNTAMNRGMEAMGGRIVKKHRLYEKDARLDCRA